MKVSPQKDQRKVGRVQPLVCRGSADSGVHSACVWQLSHGKSLGGL